MKDDLGQYHDLKWIDPASGKEVKNLRDSEKERIGKKVLKPSQMPYSQEDWGLVICGDALQSVYQIETGTIDLIITSPPYVEMFQIEKSVYFSALLDQFKRVLKPSGIMWINFNDFYKDGRTDRENGDNIAGAVTSLIRSCSPDGGIVLDPFMGIGAIGIACSYLQRKFVGIDISEECCQATVEKMNSLYFY